MRMLTEDALYLVWFRGRTTPVVVDADHRTEAIAKAREKAARGGGRMVVEARKPTPAEERTIARGAWVTTRPKGREGMRSDFGPKPRV